MTTTNFPRETSLPIDDIKALLVALEGDVDPEDLGRIDKFIAPGRRLTSVHASCLSDFMVTDDLEMLQDLGAVCRRLVELKAPYTSSHLRFAGEEFSTGSWPIEPEHYLVTCSLADAYVNAGLLDIEQPMSGELLTRAQRHDADEEEHPGLDDIPDRATEFAGLKPLACAIFSGDTSFAAYLLRSGASLDLGEVYPGESMHAIDLADEQGKSELRAMLIYAGMTARLAGVSTEHVADADTETNAGPGLGNHSPSFRLPTQTARTRRASV